MKIIYEFKTRKALNLLRVDISIIVINNANNMLIINFIIATIYLIINNINKNNLFIISSLIKI